MLSPDELKAFQLQHYKQRLAMAKNDAEKSFLRRELYRLKKNK